MECRILDAVFAVTLDYYGGLYDRSVGGRVFLFCSNVMFPTLYVVCLLLNTMQRHCAKDRSAKCDLDGTKV